MNINTTSLLKLINIQKERKTSEYFNQNKFLLFAFSFLTKKGTVQKCLIDELSFKIEEVQEYILLLKEGGYLSAEDLETFNKAVKAKNPEKKDFKEEMNEIINHINFLTNSRMTLTDDRKEYILKLLNSGKYTVSDIKAVNLYFTFEWGNNPTMKKYIRPETLYNKSFPSRLDAAKTFFDEIKKYDKEISKLCKTFYKMIELEIYPKRSLLASEVDVQQGFCSQLPVSLEQTIIHWLKSNYSIEDIINTIQVTVDNWSKNPELSKHISMSKILDIKFPERAAAVKRILEKQQSNERKIKPGVSYAEDWLNRKKGVENA